MIFMPLTTWLIRKAHSVVLRAVTVQSTLKPKGNIYSSTLDQFSFKRHHNFYPGEKYTATSMTYQEELRRFCQQSQTAIVEETLHIDA